MESNNPQNLLDETTENKLQQLREMLEQTCQRKMSTPRDFDFLEKKIFHLTHQMVNASTLKRLYGYIGNVHIPRTTTLDILCQAIGYNNWASFLEQDLLQGNIESNIVVSEHLHSRSLHKGQHIRILWNPDRVIVARYDGEEKFTVTETTNSKIKQGCTFQCSLFIQKEPLFLTNVIGLTSTPVDYICGKDNGITFSLIEAQEIIL